MQKPYDFVSINPEVEREEIIRRDRLLPDRYHGKLRLRIQTLTEMLIATGELVMEHKRLMNGLMMRNGVPVIPGSSLKGMSRTHAEMMSFACLSSWAPRVKGRDTKKHLPERNPKPCDGGDRKPEEAQTCVCCRIYGYVGKKSRVQKSAVEFSEFALVGEPERFLGTSKIPQLFAPLRDDRALDTYLNDEDLLQKKLYRHGKPQTHEGSEYQVVLPNATFSGEITFQNLTEEQLGLLVLSLGAAQGDRKFQAKLGYAKPAYFGSIQVEITDVTPYSRPFVRDLKSFTQDDLMRWAAEYRQENSFISKQIQQVVAHYQYQGNEHNEWEENARGQKGY